jgi:hypothetical protein
MITLGFALITTGMEALVTRGGNRLGADTLPIRSAALPRTEVPPS